jgi:gas vesicle protein
MLTLKQIYDDKAKVIAGLNKKHFSAALGLLCAPEKGEDTRKKITDTVDDFLKKHDIKLSSKEVADLVDDIKDSATAE